MSVIVEIQYVFDLSFYKRLDQYCLNVYDTYKVFPKVVVFAVKGFSSKAFMNGFTMKDGGSFFLYDK